jgi:hypothetical protein
LGPLGLSVPLYNVPKNSKTRRRGRVLLV